MLPKSIKTRETGGASPYLLAGHLHECKRQWHSLQYGTPAIEGLSGAEGRLPHVLAFLKAWRVCKSPERKDKIRVQAFKHEQFTSSSLDENNPRTKRPEYGNTDTDYHPLQSP
jgi:hypothetical protein